VDLVCDLHETLMGSVRGGEERPGELREVPVYIGARDGTPEDANFIPANPDLVPSCSTSFFSYVGRGGVPAAHRRGADPLPVRDHPPFRDGNGRMGRLLIMLQLYDSGLLPGPYTYLSAYFKRFGDQYRAKAPGGEPGGRLGGEWITFVLDAIAEQAIDGYDCGIELTELRESYREQFLSSPTARALVDYCFEQPYLTGPGPSNHRPVEAGRLRRHREAGVGRYRRGDDRQTAQQGVRVARDSGRRAVVLKEARLTSDGGQPPFQFVRQPVRQLLGRAVRVFDPVLEEARYREQVDGLVDGAASLEPVRKPTRFLAISVVERIEDPARCVCSGLVELLVARADEFSRRIADVGDLPVEEAQIPSSWTTFGWAGSPWRSAAGAPSK